jgi:hypothetical protein
MTPFKPNTPAPNLNFEHTETPLGVASSPNPRLPGPKVYHFTSVNQCFADHTAYILFSRADIETTCPALFHHMRRFGLLMHVGSLDPNGTRTMKSKTEAMFFPATTISTAAHAAATTDIIFGDQNQYYISFTDEFQYLGSRITTDLKDIADINNRLRQAKGQVAALGTFFRTNADTWSKRLIFLAIPTNTVLYGAESWTLTAELRRHISAFYHTSICRILGINMHHVEEYKNLK